MSDQFSNAQQIRKPPAVSRVNCVNPGYVATPMTEEVMKTRLDEVMAKVPMHRMGTPEEIAEAVVWMCSDKASFMTGASHVVDGGYYAA